MLDAKLRRLIDPALMVVAKPLALWVTPNQLTLGGFGIGMLAVPFIAFEFYVAGLVCIVINRIVDGLDGVVARYQSNNTSGSDFGGFLDLVCDFIFYTAIAAAFGLAQPEYMWVSLLLITCFVGTGSSFMAYAAIAEKRHISQSQWQNKTLHYLGGLTEGSETILFMILCCLLPQWFWLTGTVFASMCCITIATRCLRAAHDFRNE